MIKVCYSGRLCNNLLQYAFARILHHCTGLALTSEPKHFDLQDEFPNVQDLPGERLATLGEFNDTVELALTPSEILVRAYVKNQGICLRGFWQKHYFYMPHRKEIRGWLQPRNDETMVQLKDDDWVLHVRHEDYLVSRVHLTYEYYRKILHQYEPKGHVYVIGKDLERPFLEQLHREFGAVYLTGTPLQDLNLLRKAKTIVCSNSSFAWVGQFLGDPTRVFIPHPARGYWSDAEQQRMFVPYSNHILVSDDNDNV